MRPAEYALFVNDPGLTWEVDFVPGVSGPEIPSHCCWILLHGPSALDTFFFFGAGAGEG